MPHRHHRKEADSSSKDNEATSQSNLSPPPTHATHTNPFSPLRHHKRTASASREIRETRNARSEYTNSQDDGASQRRINQYLIQQEIGRGSFGSVHLATDQFGNEYAVKEFSKHRLRRRAKSNLLKQTRQQRQQTGLPGLLSSRPDKQFGGDSDDNAFDLIREEIAIMKKMNHDNLVSLIEVLDDPEEDSLYMVLEMCKKGVVMKVDIEAAVEPYDEQTCRYWFRDLLLGVEYLHSQGVVHRDIKPDNCLVTEDNTLKIVDFGVSEMFDKSEDMKIAKSAGSPAFMAPELCIVQKDGVAGKPADIWSMGVTLYCLRFGHVPFTTSNIIDLHDSIANHEVEMPTECSPEFIDLLQKLLMKDPNKRITMAELREHPWVTNNGKDVLLPPEENCSSPVTEPTEEEMNTAITGNMGRLIAVLKAAGKFKSLIERTHPELMESIMGRASKMVAPPLTMSNLYETGSDIKSVWKRHMSRGNQDPAEAPVSGSGIYRQTDVAKEEQSISDRLQASGISKHTPEPRHSEPKPPFPNHLDEKARRASEQQDRGSYDDTAKGHAHDILKDQVFVDVGEGPCGVDEEHDDHHHDYVVSESPSQTEDTVFEKAYAKEVDDIKSSGRDTTIFRTRRVEEDDHERMMGEGQTSSGSDQKQSVRGILGSAVGRAMQVGGQKIQDKYVAKSPGGTAVESKDIKSVADTKARK